VRPIAPDEVKAKKETSVPGEAIESFNELLIKNSSIGVDSIIIVQSDVVELMMKKGLNRGDIFTNHWLDVEDIYRAVGWHVEYDKPGYNERYDARFIFERRKKI